MILQVISRRLRGSAEATRRRRDSKALVLLHLAAMTKRAGSSPPDAGRVHCTPPGIFLRPDGPGPWGGFRQENQVLEPVLV